MMHVVTYACAELLMLFTTSYLQGGGVPLSIVYVLHYLGAFPIQNGLSLAGGGGCLYFGANW